MKKLAAVVLILFLILSMGSVGLAADAPHAVPADPGSGYTRDSRDNGSVGLESTVSIEVAFINGGILFTVTDSRTGAPIEGATVTERLDTQEPADAVLVPGTTDENGNLLRKLPASEEERTYVYVVNAVGFKASDEITLVYRRGSIVSVVGLVPEVMPVLFAVTNETGASVGGAEVRISSVSRSARTAEEIYTCDGKGFARCELPDGIYSYTVAHPHHEDFAGILTIDRSTKDSHTERVQVQRRQFQVGFTVQNEDGNPVKDAIVTMAGQSVRTDAKGYALAVGLYAGEYSFFAICEGYETYTRSLSVPTGEDSYTIILHQAAQPQPTQQPDGNIGNDPGDNGSALEPTVQPAVPPSASASPSASATVMPIDTTPVDVVLLVKYVDGTPAAGVNLELHSNILYGMTGEDGTETFHDVEMGRHTVYVKDGGKMLAQVEFDLKRSDITTLLIEDGLMGITVRAAIKNIVIELTLDPANHAGDVTAVREGYISKISGNDAGGKTEENPGIVISGATDDRGSALEDEETFFGTPFCLTEQLFGGQGPFCMLLGLSCWIWYAIMIITAIVVVLLVLRKKKRAKEHANCIIRSGRFIDTRDYTVYDDKK